MATLTLTADQTTAFDLDAATNTITVAAGESWTLSGDITKSFVGDASVEKLGDGELILTGTNAQDSTIITAGILSVSEDGHFGAVDGDISLGATLRFTGNTDITLSDRDFTLTAPSTIDNLVDDTERGGSVSINGIIDGAFNLSITGGNNMSYLPTTALNGVNTSSGDLVIAEGNNVEINGDDAVWAGNVTLSGDLKGNGTVTGTVNSTGGRVSPGSTVGSTMTLGGLVLDTDSELYVGFENDTVDNIAITGTGSLTMDGTVTFVPYQDSGTVGAYSVITGSATPTDNTADVETFAGYADGNEDVDNGSFAQTVTGAVTADGYAITLA